MNDRESYKQVTGKLDCNKCVWGTRDGGCASWDCEFVDRDEAVNAWRKTEKANMQLSGKDATSDSISRQAAIDMVRDVCDEIMSGCDSYYDPETGDEVYKDILEVNAILKCNKEIRIALRNMPSAEPEIKPISYTDCSNAMLKMWIDNVLTDGEYNKIMDKLNAKHKGE